MSPDFSQGRLHAGLAQSTSSVALAWHTAMSNTPIMGNTSWWGVDRNTVAASVTPEPLIGNEAGSLCASSAERAWSPTRSCILAEGAIALPVTLSGGALFAN